jgi:hypothetical protein
MRALGRFKGLAVAVAVLASAAFGQELPKIAVYVTGDVGAGEKEALGTRILTSLVNSGRYIAIERSNAFLAEIDKEHIKQRSGAIDDSQISELGKQFGVKFVCIAAINPVLGDFQVSARIVDVETAVVVFIGDAFSPMKTTNDLALVSDKVVENMFSGKNTTPQKQIIEPIPQLAPEPITLPPSAAVSETKIETIKTEPMKINESKYRSIQKKISLEMGGAFVPFCYYDGYYNGSGHGSGYSMGGDGYMSVDLIYFETVVDMILLDVSKVGAKAVILAKYPIVYEMIKVSPIFGWGLLVSLSTPGGPWIFGGKIDVGISEIAYLRSEYLYSGGTIDGREGWGASFKVGGGLDIG